MFRIRRRLGFILCFVCVSIFLTLYVIINYAAPNTDKKPNVEALVGNSAQYENEVFSQKKQDTRNFEEKLENALHDKVVLLKKTLKKTSSSTKKQNRPTIAKNFTGKCVADVLKVPQPELQMLDLYDKMSFADIDGGAWKQGWNIKYDSLKYNDHNKLKVFVVPHSHNDPGWIKTFNDYYEHDTKHILSNALRHLHDNPDMKFIWAEISYFAKFYEDLGPDHKTKIKKLVKDNQLEFVTGGWVMPDEANSHWYSVLIQLTEGQTWLKKHFNKTPQSSWSIDPFGHSPTVPYILQKSGFKNHLIQRTHYSVKKELALHRNLEFHWRQLWDDSGETELFTHMMPFYSYDIPHTCGPDPKICCQFDFKRMQGFGLSCPWHVPPKAIKDYNVAARSEMIVDQWKKKAELYRSNVVLIPLGDDFRYSQSTEWDVQRINYEKLFEHINSERQYFTEAKFGTLQEYFDAVEMEGKEFPTLSGDFFTYADRADNYWSGYFTSRPYHKRLDRVLLHYVRSAEMMSAWCSWLPSANVQAKLENARRQLSLFQHHDGITGTAKTHVVEDYANRMMKALKDCQFVMQQSAYYLLTNPKIYNADYTFDYFYLDDSRWPGANDTRVTIILAEELPNKYVVFHNALPTWREELVDFYVSRPFISVRDFNGVQLKAQVSPVWTWHRHTISNTVAPQASTTKFRLIFRVRVPPLGLATYVIHAEPADSKPAYTSFASNIILTNSPMSLNLGDYPEDVKFSEHQEMTLQVADGPAVSFSKEGFMKAIQMDSSTKHSTPVKLSFWKYGTRVPGDRSGAYLFIPNGPATPLVNMQSPVVLVTKGLLESSISVGLPFAIHQTILNGDAPEIRNLVDISNMDDTEVVMRFSTNIASGDTFYTDLNALQIIKRKRLEKLPIQANYYPVPSAVYIEDERTRLTLLTAQPLGGSSLASGEFEIMQDRRLTMDDARGLGQGVLDNQPVLHIFRILLEQIDGCHHPAENYPSGVHTHTAYGLHKVIQHPLDKFIFKENEWMGVKRDFGAERASVANDVEVLAIRDVETAVGTNLVHGSKISAQLSTGIILHRTLLMNCNEDSQSTGILKLTNLLRVTETAPSISGTTLTFLQETNKLFNDTISLCPMDTKAFIVKYTRKSHETADDILS